MPNDIALFKSCVPLLDEVYKEASLTAVLDGAPELAQPGASAEELVIPLMEMSGLADYSRASGYVQGDVTLTHQTVKCNFDRGRMFTVDALDDAETAGIAFGRLSGEFIRTRVVPELDAFRLSRYASFSGVHSVAQALTNGGDVVDALRACVTYMDDREVPYDGRILFILPGLRGLVEDLDTTKSRAVLSRFAQVISVPQTRMYTGITQTDSGFQKAAQAKDLSFLCVHPSAVIQFQKHLAPKIISPEMNPDADAWKFGYRSVGIASVYRSKTDGIYAHSGV